MHAHLFGQVGTHTGGHNQLPIFHYIKRTWEDIHACFFMRAILDDVMSQSELTTKEFIKC